MRLLCFPLLAALAHGQPSEKPWPRHTIDDTAVGADGVRLIDVNTDGRPDVVTGFEQAGLIRVYFNPSRVDSRNPWRQVTVGRVRSPEDAVFADLDGDLAFDVVSSTEASERTLYVHWAPKDHDRYWDETAWKTEAVPDSRGRMMWMWALPMQVDARHGLDLIAGGKGEGAAIGWFQAPPNPRDMAAWEWRALRPVGWTMSIYAADMDRDGDLDILFSDRRLASSGVGWLENPGAARAALDAWREHPIGSAGDEVMFIDYADFDGDGLLDVAAAVKPRQVHIHRRLDPHGKRWAAQTIPFPDTVGTAKSVRIVDVDLDGKVDLVWTSEQAHAPLEGVVWMSLADRKLHPISGKSGVKFDIIEMLDLDGDQDLDLLTTEEETRLGVIWYENPFGR